MRRENPPSLGRISYRGCPVAIRILVVDEHAVVRTGLSAFLNLRPDLQVVGDVGTLDEALRMTRALQPDVVLIDLYTYNGAGLAGLRQLKRLGFELRVLVLTASEDPDLAREALHAGADGYLPKRALATELLNAIRAVGYGELYVHPSFARGLLGYAEDPPPTPSVIIAEALTPREIDILRLVAQGFTNRQAAEHLMLSVRTVEGYRANLMDKLGMRSRAELVSYALEHQLLGSEFAVA
jgi:two-component system response regulator NreC